MGMYLHFWDQRDRGSSGMLKEVPPTASAVGTIRICQLAATKMVE